MDTRRLSTGDVLAAGILAKPVPDTDIPTDRRSVSVDLYEPYGDAIALSDDKALRSALEGGAVLHVSEYYGIPHVWSAGDGTYRGVLLQYRVVTEAPTFESADDALEWFAATAHRVAG